MSKKWLIIAGIVAVAIYLSAFKSGLPTPGASGNIGKFTGYWDGSVAYLQQAITNQQDCTDLFNSYPAIQQIIDVNQTIFQRAT